MKAIFEEIESDAPVKYYGKKNRDELFTIEIKDFPFTLFKNMCISASVFSEHIAEREGNYIVADVRIDYHDGEFEQMVWIYFEG